MTHKKPNITQFKTERKKYSPQFKEQALERAKKDGVAKVAKDLGIAESIIYNWRKQFEKTGVPFEDQKIQAAELARLRRENTRLSDEVAFLKKAAAYFAKEPKRGTQ
jgi:transposase